MDESQDTGGKPHQFGQCTECGNVYPVQVTGDDEFRPIGTKGICSCGNDAFVSLSEK